MSVGNFESMLEDCKHGLYDFTNNGKCSECGNCCSRYLPLNNHEINTIRRYIEKHHIKQQKHAVNVYANPMFDVTCPFLDDTKPNHKCTIYDVRPMICREFKCDAWRDENNIPKRKIFNANLNVYDVVELFFSNNSDSAKHDITEFVTFQ